MMTYEQLRYQGTHKGHRSYGQYQYYLLPFVTGVLIDLLETNHLPLPPNRMIITSYTTNLIRSDSIPALKPGIIPKRTFSM